MTRFDHVGLNVPDLDAGVAWYGAALGLEEELRFEVPEVGLCGAMLRHPSGYRVEVLSRPGAVPGLQATDPAEAALTLGFSHFALHVDDVGRAYDAMLAAGAAARMAPRPAPGPPHLPMAFVADPWGNLVELLER